MGPGHSTQILLIKQTEYCFPTHLPETIHSSNSQSTSVLHITYLYICIYDCLLARHMKMQRSVKTLVWNFISRVTPNVVEGSERSRNGKRASLRSSRVRTTQENKLAGRISSSPLCDIFSLWLNTGNVQLGACE